MTSSGSSSFGERFSGIFDIIKSAIRIIVIVAVLAGIVLLIKSAVTSFGGFGFNTVGKRRRTFGKNFTVECYNYNNSSYIGNAKKETPNGINLCYQRLSVANGKFILAEIKKDVQNKEGVIYDGRTLTVGRIQKNVFTGGWAMSVSGNTVILAYYKKNNPSGYGLLRTGNETQIVNFNKDRKVIATYSDGKWIKPNGKEFKLGKNKNYKKLILNDDINISVKNVDFCIDLNNLNYISDSFDFTGSNKNFIANYYSKQEHISIEYNAQESIQMLIHRGTAYQGYTITPSED